ncbi:MAG: hypothetical protein JO332_12815 [Planctomycetaceae bacterium]|nr:hypothetical protein [Planctomycetaceae bacterium]
MKRLACCALLAVLLVAPLGGCHGPQRLSRGLDEWANNGYIDSPWIYGNLLAHLLLAGATAVTWTADSFINIYFFWVDDAEPFGSGKGTPYPFRAVTPAKR